METKDWIIMIVPIVVNGICVFIFQQIIKHKFSRMEKRTEYRQIILREFLQMLKDYNEKFWCIRNSDQEVLFGGSDFSDLWNAAAEQIKDVFMYHNAHKAALCGIEEVYEKCIQQYEKLIDILKQGAILHEDGYHLTDKCRKDFSHEYLKMDILIKDCLKQCEQQILQFK